MTESERPSTISALTIALTAVTLAATLLNGCAREEPAPAFGSLYVKSRPENTSVLVDGEDAGSDGVVLDSIPVGRHTVRVSLPGCNDLDTIVTIEASATTRLDVTLDCAPAQTESEQSKPVDPVADLTGRIEAAIAAAQFDSARALADRLSALDADAGALFAARVSSARTERVSHVVEEVRTAWRAGEAERRDAALNELRALDPANEAVERYSGPVLGALLHTLAGHTGKVWAVAIAGDTVISAGQDGTVRQWRADTGQPIGTIETDGGAVRCVALSGGRLVTGSARGNVCVWDRATGQLVTTLAGHEGVVSCVAVSGGKAVSGSFDGTIRIWDLATGQLDTTLSGNTNRPLSVAMSGDTMVSGSWDGGVRVWEVHTGRLIRTLAGHSEGVGAVAIVGHQVVSGSWDGFTKIRRLDTGEETRMLYGNRGPVECLAAADGRIVTGSRDKTLKVWDMESGERTRVLRGHNSTPTAVAAQGETIVSGSENGAVLIWRAPWELPNGE